MESKEEWDALPDDEKRRIMQEWDTEQRANLARRVPLRYPHDEAAQEAFAVEWAAMTHDERVAYAKDASMLSAIEIENGWEHESN